MTSDEGVKCELRSPSNEGMHPAAAKSAAAGDAQAVRRMRDDMADHTEKLNALYAAAMPELKRIAEAYDGVSGPLFMAVPDGYERAGVRVMIVGQQTRDWPSVSVGLDELLRAYREFDLGRHYTASPFWQASHSVFAELNPTGPERAFLWSNLVKMDQHCKRPSPQLEEDVCRLGLLVGELQILKPEAVVFFTGPRYDERLRCTFPGVEYTALTPDVALLRHADLPPKAYRTYHPRYLWQAKKRAALGAIVEDIHGGSGSG